MSDMISHKHKLQLDLSIMAVCSLCSTIPFGSLPDFPPHENWFRTYDNSECPMLIRRSMQNEPHGFPWHQNLDSLAAASRSCPLCAIVHQGFQMWLVHYEESRQTAFYQEFKDFYEDAVPHGQRLFLSRRIGGGPGFDVFAREPGGRGNYLLTGVVFSVSKGTRLSHGASCMVMDRKITNSRQSSISQSATTTTRPRLGVDVQLRYCCIFPG